MYRHKFQEFGPVQRTVCIASSFYKEYIDDLIDDLIWSKFGIVQKKEKLLSIYEVYDWLLEEDSEHSIQYTNDVSICFLLIKVDAIQLAHKLAEFHNARSLRDSGRRAIYVSRDVIQADRDVRIHFPESSNCRRISKTSIEILPEATSTRR
uniref:Uncharacterized protein n=1 Tax=Acrobeloides nanus TaxID=290746 RepID=A0A914D6I6_9BILA